MSNSLATRKKTGTASGAVRQDTYMFFKTCKETAQAAAVFAAAVIEFAGRLLAAHCRHQHRA
jgi:hypothetical protein